MLPLDIYLDIRKKKIARTYNFHFLNETETCNIGDKRSGHFLTAREIFLSDITCEINFQVIKFCSELGITDCGQI